MKKLLTILFILLLGLTGCTTKEPKSQTTIQAEKTVSETAESKENPDKKEEKVEQEEKTSSESSSTKDEEKTQEAKEVQSQDTAKTEEIMAEFSELSGTKYYQCTPDAIKIIYGIPVPDEFLMVAYLNEERIEFSYNGYLTEGEPKYTLVDCYVNEGLTALILFVEKDGEKLVFESYGEIVDGKVNLSISHSELLNSFGR